MNPVDPTAIALSAQSVPPCGPSLEYDPDYLLLLARLAPRTDVQYGGFVGAPEAPDWNAVERDAERLLARSLDIALLVCHCRAATRLRRAAGLDAGLQRLLAALQEWPDVIHPQLLTEGVSDPTVRANALAALADPDGLLGDVAALLPHAGDEAARSALRSAAAHARAIDRWAGDTLGESAPALQPLLKLLAPFMVSAAEPGRADRSLGAGADPTAPPLSDTVGSARSPVMPAAGSARDRSDMRVVLADARAWFETHEPSSPIALLLLQAESMVGLHYGQLTQAVPAEWLSRWQSAAGPAVPAPPQAAR